MIIKRVGPISCAKIAGVIYAIIGLFLGACVSVVAMIGGFSTQQAQTPYGAGVMAAMGVGSIVIFPIIYGILGFIFTVISAWIYNLVAGKVGGIEIEVE